MVTINSIVDACIITYIMMNFYKHFSKVWKYGILMQYIMVSIKTYEEKIMIYRAMKRIIKIMKIK